MCHCHLRRSVSGLNDVIRAIVLEAYHAYNTPSVLGIRYGLEGFIPACHHE